MALRDVAAAQGCAAELAVAAVPRVAAEGPAAAAAIRSACVLPAGPPPDSALAVAALVSPADATMAAGSQTAAAVPRDPVAEVAARCAAPRLSVQALAVALPGKAADRSDLHSEAVAHFVSRQAALGEAPA